MPDLTTEQQIAWYAQRQGYPKSATVTFDDRHGCYVLSTGTQSVYCGRSYAQACSWLSRRLKPRDKGAVCHAAGRTNFG